MKFSRHAIKRLLQRGMSEDICKVVCMYGKQKFLPGSAIGFTLTSETCRDIASELRTLNRGRKIDNKPRYLRNIIAYMHESNFMDNTKKFTKKIRRLIELLEKGIPISIIQSEDGIVITAYYVR